METVKQVFLALLREELTGEICGELPRDVDYKELYILCRQQNLTHIISNALQKKNVLAGLDKLGGLYWDSQMSSYYHGAKLEYEWNQFAGLLEQLQIPYIPLKGAVFEALYPQRNMRISGDVDLLIHPEDLPRLLEMLEAREDYTVGERASHDVTVFTQNKMRIEVHYRLFEYNKDIGAPLENVWETASPVCSGSLRYRLSGEILLYYHIVHMLKHFLFGGCGVRFFMDLLLLNQKAGADFEKLNLLLEKAKLTAFYTQTSRLAQVWFGNATHNESTVQMEDYILSGGVFGTHDNYLSVEQAQNANLAQSTLRRLFPTVEYMVGEYPVLKKWRILLPICYIRRWIAIGPAKGWKRFRTWLRKNQEIESNQKDKAKDMLRSLGLLDIKL